MWLYQECRVWNEHILFKMGEGDKRRRRRVDKSGKVNVAWSKDVS